MQGNIKLVVCLCVLMSSVLASGCVSIVAATAAGTAVTTSSDRRSVGTQLDDSTIATRVSNAIDEIPQVDELANINVNVYNKQVLLTGQSTNQQIINQATAKCEAVPQVLKVHNQIRLGEIIPTGSTLHDHWIGSKIRVLMGTDENVPLLKLDLIVEDSEVFIMGKLTRSEATAAVELVRNVTGVTKVVRVMEIVDE